jgi:hypothetical protein
MCWNSEVSLNTFIYAIISATILLLLNNTRYLYIMTVLSISSMQLLEYFAWININDKKMMKILSIIGIIIIFIQIFLFTNLIQNKKYKNIMLMLILLILIIYIILIFPQTTLDMIKAENGHLAWLWSDVNIVFILICFIFYLAPFFINKWYGFFMFGLISLIISMYFFYKYKTFGSIWCYISNILWVVLLIDSITRLMRRSNIFKH